MRGAPFLRRRIFAVLLTLLATPLTLALIAELSALYVSVLERPDPQPHYTTTSTLGSTIELAVSSTTINLGALNTIDSTLSTQDVIVTVSTDNPTGYALTVQMSGTEQCLRGLTNTDVPCSSLNDNQRFRPIDASTSVVNFPVGHWGASIAPFDVFNPILPTGTLAWMIRQTDGISMDDQTTLRIGAIADFSMRPDTYTGTIVFTAVANEWPHACMVVASGRIGTEAQGGAPWELCNDGTLIVQPGRMDSTATSSPWIAHNTSINRVVFDFDEPVLLGPDFRGIFAGLTNLTEIIGLEYLDTSGVRRFDNLFNGASNITNLDMVAMWDTASAQRFDNMFRYTSNISELDLSSWNTSDVRQINGMFRGMTSLDTLNISTWNTSRVTNMTDLFRETALTELDVSHFDTGVVTAMSSMFRDMFYLEYLDISNFNTNNVTNMGLMFLSATSLKSLDVSHFNVNNVTDMNSMFRNANLLTTVGDLYSWDTSSVIRMDGMFRDLPNLVTLDVSNFNTSNVTSMSNMFNGASSLAVLDVSNFNTSNVVGDGMAAIFRDMHALTSLDVTGFDTSNVTNMLNMFRGTHSLTSLDVTNFDTSNVIDMTGLFRYATGLITIDVSNFDLSNVTMTDNLFSGMTSLHTLDLSTWDTRNVETMASMFRNTAGLRTLILGGYFYVADDNPALPSGSAWLWHGTNSGLTFWSPDLMEFYRNIPINDTWTRP